MKLIFLVIIIAVDNLFTRMVAAVRLKILGHSEGSQGRKEGRKDFSVEYSSPQNNFKPHFVCFTAVFRFVTPLVPSPPYEGF